MGEVVQLNPAPCGDAPLAAAGMSIAVDSTGHVLFRLHDEAGKIYAQATIPPHSASEVVNQVTICAMASAGLRATTSPAVH